MKRIVLIKLALTLIFSMILCLPLAAQHYILSPFKDDNSQKWGLKTQYGKIFIQAKYDQINIIDNGLAFVKLNGKLGIIGDGGQIVVPCKFDDVKYDLNIRWYRVKSEGKWGVFDSYIKKVTLPFIYDDIFPCKYDPLYLVKSDTKWGAIDGGITKVGKIIIPIKYEELKSWSWLKNALSAKLDGKWGIISTKGKEIIPLIYDEELSFSTKETTSTQRDGKWGIIDRTGREVVPCKYDRWFDFSSNKLTAVQINGKYGFLDPTGAEIIACRYESISSSGFKEGLLAVSLDGKWGYIDETGKEVIPFNYSLAGDFYNGITYVELNGKRININRNGENITEEKK